MLYMKQVLLSVVLWQQSLADLAPDALEPSDEYLPESCELLQHRVDLDPAPPSIQAHLGDSCSDECIPAVFVVSSGRTGGTTIMHMLNLIPGFDLKGHNKGMLGSFLNLHEKLKSKYQSYKRSTLYSWVHSPIQNETEIRCALRMMVLGELNPQSKAHVVGYKETDWKFDSRLQDLSLLMDVFPCSKVVLSYRNDLEDQLLSMRAVYGEFNYFRVRDANQQMDQFAKQHPDRTFTFPLEDFSVGRFNDLLRFLGEDLNCHYVDVIRDNAGEDFTRIGTSRDDVIRCAGVAP